MNGRGNPAARPLTDHEGTLVAWMVKQAGSPAVIVAQLPGLHVVGRCDCGCASVDFSVFGRIHSRHLGMEQIGPDYYWNSPNGSLCSIFIFAVDGLLAGLDVWSVDGFETPSALPEISQLRLVP